MVLELMGRPSRRASLGPAEWYRLSGALLYAGGTGRVMAAYCDGFWETEIAQFTAICCGSACTCTFEQGTGRAEDVEGPYATVSLVGAVLWADDHALARLDPETALWRLLRTGNDYGSICWRPVSRCAKSFAVERRLFTIP